MNKRIIKKFYKRIANGEQNIIIGKDGITEVPASYYWQSNSVFNIIGYYVTIIEESTKYLIEPKLRKKVEDLLYGEFGMVAQMWPLQQSYNTIKNRMVEIFNRSCMPVLSVEDGSVDIDALEEEGLTPGKILVYRQGAAQPSYLESSISIVDLIKAMQVEEANIKDQMLKIYESFDYKRSRIK